MSGYTKLFASILDSTVWQTPQATRLVWITMLAMSDRDGVVDGSIPGLAKRSGVSLSEAEEALLCFMSPDPYSRTKDHEGRRIEEIDGGWRLLNHRKHRDKLSRAEQNEKAAERMRVRRSAGKENNREQPRTTTNNCEQFANVRDVRHADADADPEERENAREDAPPSKPDAKPESRVEPTAVPIPRVASIGGAHVQEWADTLREVFERQTRTAPKPTHAQQQQLAEHVRDISRLHKVPYRDAAEKLAELALQAGHKFPFDTLQADPYAALGPQKLETTEEYQRRVNHYGESFEAYQARIAKDPWKGIVQ